MPTATAATAANASPTTPAPAAIVPPEQFVESLCGTWNTYYTRYLELQGGFTGSNDLVEHRQRLTDMTAGMQTAAQGLLDSIPALAAPEGENGTKVRQVFIDFFRQEYATVANYHSELPKLDTSDADAFTAGLQKIIDSPPPNNTEPNLQALAPLGRQILDMIDNRDDDCATIFIAI